MVLFMTVYADNAATTKTSETALKAMLPYMREIYGNPSSLHTLGQTAAEALFSAKEEISQIFSAAGQEKLSLHQEEVKRIIKAILSAAAIGEKKERSISFQPRLNIMRFCIRLKS